jgi:hypothetical protein
VVIHFKRVDKENLVMLIGADNLVPFQIRKSQFAFNTAEPGWLNDMRRDAHPLDYQESMSDYRLRNYQRYPRSGTARGGLLRLDADLDRSDLNLRLLYLDGLSLNKHDKLLKSKNGRFKSKYNNNFIFNHRNTSYLFFANSYSFFRQGIGYVTIQNGTISDEEFLKVSQEYNYLLPLSKKVSESAFIIPYTRKGQLGFVRVNF